MTGKDKGGLFIAYDDVWLLDGVRTPFVDYNGALGLVSPTDLGIKVARAVFERPKVSPGAWRRLVSMLTCCRGILDCIRECLLIGLRFWCSAFAELELRRSGRLPMRSL